MACRCPVCKKTIPSVSSFVEHVSGSQDNTHQKWLESYCDKNKIDFGRMILQQINGNQDAYKPLANPFKKDFCKD